MLWIPLAVGAASLVGGMLANRSNRQESERNRGFQERMRNTQWQSAVEDMRAAGINPALAYQQGPNAAPGGNVQSQSDAVTPGITSALSTARMKKELKLLDAQVRERDALATREEGRNAAYGVSRTRDGSLALRYDMPGLASLTAAEVLTAESGAQSAASIARRNRSLASITGLGGSMASRAQPLFSWFDRSVNPGTIQGANRTSRAWQEAMKAYFRRFNRGRYNWER